LNWAFPRNQRLDPLPDGLILRCIVRSPMFVLFGAIRPEYHVVEVSTMYYHMETLTKILLELLILSSLSLILTK